MGYNPRSLSSILNVINRDIFLPHIQRPFVWEEQQISKLLDSLMLNYPVQTLLFWKTDEEIKTRKFMDVINSETNLHQLYDSNISSEGQVKTFVLDGQQRIQSLFCLYKGGLLSKTGAIEDAFIDITSHEVDETTEQIFNVKFQPRDTLDRLPLFRIKHIAGKYLRTNAEAISDEINTTLDSILNENDEEKRVREKIVRMNISQLRSIFAEDRHFWIEELDGMTNNYPYKTILDIFVRVNSGGTKLNASDLMFSAMKEISPEIEEKLELMSDALTSGEVNIEVETILKGILLVNDRGATVNPQKFSGIEGKALVQNIDTLWDSTYASAFQALRDFIVSDLKIDNSKLIRSYNSLVPIFEYFYFNPTPTPANKSRLKSYFYKAQLFSWFSSRTDGILDYLHNNYLKNCTNQDFPISNILDYFNRTKKQVEFTKSVLLDHSLRYFLLHLLYTETHNQSAFNVKLKNNDPHIDHIYPKSKLSKTPFTLKSSEINHIGNYRFVGATDNIRKRAENPDTYFLGLKRAMVVIERHLLLRNYSDDPTTLLMDPTTYEQFRDERTEAIYQILEPIINFQ